MYIFIAALIIAVTILILFYRRGKHNKTANKPNSYDYRKDPQISKEREIQAYERKNWAEDGFLHPDFQAVTNHANQRMKERLGLNNEQEIYTKAREAYLFGKSANQLPADSAFRIRQKEGEDSVALIYRNFIYIFSKDNVLKTVYKNEDIHL